MKDKDAERACPRTAGGARLEDERVPLMHRGCEVEGDGWVGSLLKGEGRRRTRHAAAACLLSVAVAVSIKGAWFASPSPTVPSYLISRVGRGEGTATTAAAVRARAAASPPTRATSGRGGRTKTMSLAGGEEPDEDTLRGQLGRGWVYRHTDDPLQSSGAGGPGMPLAVSSAKDPEELKGHQFHRVFKQRNFRDFVVDSRTGRPLELTKEQKRLYAKEAAAADAKEQEEMDGLDPFEDEQIPTKYIYPDGEDIVPRKPVKVHGLFDKRIGADGKVVYSRGRVFGVFRKGAFDNDEYDQNVTSFGKMGEKYGFYDRPLKIRNPDYKAIRLAREKAIEEAQEEREEGEGQGEGEGEGQGGGNSTNSTGGGKTFYCSGQECSEMWGKAGAGDRIVRIEDGKVIKGFESVGPGKENQMSMPSFDLDEHVDPSTGDLLDGCVGPQCKPTSTIDLSKVLDLSDKEGEPVNGTAVFGVAIPPDPDMDVSDRIAWARAHKPSEENGGYVEPDAEPYAMDPAARSRYEKFLEQQRAAKNARGSGGGSGAGIAGKKWDAASWAGFVIIGPVLTAGVSVFVFMTRGPAWGLGVFLGLVLLDCMLFYFG